MILKNRLKNNILKLIILVMNCLNDLMEYFISISDEELIKDWIDD